MAAITMLHLSAARDTKSLFAATKDFFKNEVKAFAHEMIIRKAIREMHKLSDAQLRDLGITRGEISHVVREGR